MGERLKKALWFLTRTRARAYVYQLPGDNRLVMSPLHVSLADNCQRHGWPVMVDPHCPVWRVTRHWIWEKST